MMLGVDMHMVYFYLEGMFYNIRISPDLPKYHGVHVGPYLY